MIFRLPPNQLPTNGQVLCFFRHVRWMNTKSTYSSKPIFPEKQQIIEVVVEKIKDIWINQASFPAEALISDDAISRKINRIFDHGNKCPKGSAKKNHCYTEIVRLYHQHKSRPSSTFQAHFDKFQNLSNSLFDICQPCPNHFAPNCPCVVCSLVVRKDIDFLIDQQTNREVFITPSIDVEGSQEVDHRQTVYTRRIERKQKEEATRAKQLKKAQEERSNRTAEDFDNYYAVDEYEEEEEEAMEIDTEYIPNRTRSDEHFFPYHFLLPTIEGGISAEKAARLLNGFCRDMEARNWRPLPHGFTVSCTKMKQDKVRQQVMEKHIEKLSALPLTSLYFDSKIDLSLVEVEENNTKVRKIKREDHYSIVIQPGGVIAASVKVEKPVRLDAEGNVQHDHDEVICDSRLLYFAF